MEKKKRSKRTKIHTVSKQLALERISTDLQSTHLDVGHPFLGTVARPERWNFGDPRRRRVRGRHVCGVLWALVDGRVHRGVCLLAERRNFWNLDRLRGNPWALRYFTAGGNRGKCLKRRLALNDIYQQPNTTTG